MEDQKQKPKLDPSDPCAQPANCEEPSCQDLIVADHEIDEDSFNTMIGRYNETSYSTYMVWAINDMLATLNCKNGDYIKFDDNGGTTDIMLTPVHGLAGKYSVAFFKGVFRQHMPSGTDTMEFHHGINDLGNLTAATKLIVGGTTVFFGDLTELYP